MARSSLEDMMSSYPFWLFDVFEFVSPALPAFNPLWGFATCSAPEFTADMKPIREGNRPYPRQAYRSGTLKTITLTRGVRFFDNDFYRWMTVASQGNPAFFRDLTFGLDTPGPTPRRNLILIHFLARLPIPAGIEQATRNAQGGSFTSVVNNNDPTQNSPLLAVTTAIAGTLAPYSAAFATVRLPGRAWILTGCLPGRYKAASDFDANSGELSIQELDVVTEGIEQISLSDLPTLAVL